MQVICSSKFEKHCSVAFYNDWEKAKTNGWDLWHTELYMWKILAHGEMPRFLKYESLHFKCIFFLELHRNQTNVFLFLILEENLICWDFLKGESDKIHQIEMIKKKIKKDCGKIYTIQISMWKCYHYILPFSGKYSFQRLIVLEIHNSDVLHFNKWWWENRNSLFIPWFNLGRKISLEMYGPSENGTWSRMAYVCDCIYVEKIVKSFKNFVYKEAKKIVKYSSLYVKLLKFCFQSSLQSYWLH